MNKLKTKKSRWILYLFTIICFILGIFVYRLFFTRNVEKEFVLFIPTGANFEQIKDSLEGKLKDEESFKDAAQKVNLFENIKAGRYIITEGMSNYNIVRKLKAGKQDELTVVVNNFSSLYILAGKVGKKIEPDSLAILNAAKKIAAEKGFKSIEEVKARIIPNSYNFYWNISAEEFYRKMMKEYDVFWNKERIKKAKETRISPLEVITLASIVERESSKADERPRIAGLYINRLRKKMKLQSDPTIIYAKQAKEGYKITIQRVLEKDLFIDSPYNTYKYEGLPPYPICIPSINSIESVLEYEKHDYIYMCAKPGYNGHHNFATNFSSHQANAKLYQNWLNSEGIKR